MQSRITPSRPWRRLFALHALILVALLWFPGGTRAGTDDSWTSMFHFNGFGTLGEVHSSDDRANYTDNAYQPKGPGFDGRWSATPDSKLGAQVTVNFTDQLSAVVQFVSQYQYNGTYTPYLEWGNVKYQITPDFSVRAGRITLPTFMSSDSLNVGYTLPYVRIPIEIFGQLPVTHSDGVDTSYRFQVGAVTSTVQAFVGNYDSKVPGNIVYDIRGLRGIVDTVEYGAATLHVSYQELHYSYGPFIVNDTQKLLGVGMSYDPGKWFVLGEWIRAPDQQEGLFYGWYAFGGYRVGKFTPYLGYARTYMTTVGSLGIPPIINQNTASLGMRWDFAKNIDLKLQLDHTKLNGGLNTYFVNQQPNFDATGTLNILSLTVDFVF